MSDPADQIALSLEAVAERCGDPAPQIYARLFANYPEMEALFVRDTSGAVRGEMLAVAFACLMDAGGQGAYGANLIRAEIINHEGVGVPPDVFARFFWVVMESCREILGDAWSPDFAAAWSAWLTDFDRILAQHA